MASIYENMREVLEEQKAAAQAMTQAANQMTVSLGRITTDFDDIAAAYGQPGSGGPRPGGGGGNGGNPNGGRPTMSGNQTRRPYHGNPGTDGQGSYGGLRNAAFGSIERRFGASSGNRFREITNPDGTHGGYREFDNNGRLVAEHDSAWKDTAEGARALAGAASREGASNLLGRLSSGLGGARAVPYIGAALAGAEAAKEALTFVGEQRKANAAYQSISNGTNLSGLNDRVNQFGFQVGQLFSGGLTWGDSQAAYQGVAALGPGVNRDQGVGFITQAYKQMGVSVADSLKLIQTAATGLNTSLLGLSSGLHQTREAAAAVGLNANVGQQVLGQNIQSLNQSFSSTSGGTTSLASTLSALQVGQGRDMLGVSPANMLNNTQSQYMLASNLGISQSALLGRIQNGDPSVLAAQQAQIGKGLQTSDAARNFIRQQIRQAGGAQAITPEIANRISTRLQSMSDSLNFDSRSLMYNLQANAPGLGIQNQEQATRYLINQVGGLGEFNNNTIRNQGLVKARLSFADGDVKAVNPVIDEAKKNRTIAGNGILIDGHVMTLEDALKKNPGAIATGKAVVAGTGGATVKELLGGRHQSKYYDTKAAADEIFGVGQKGAKQQKRFQEAYSKAIQGNAGFIKGVTGQITAADIIKNMPGNKKISEDELGDINAFLAAQNPKTDAGQKRDGGSKGKITVEVGPELQGLLKFSPSGQVNIVNGGQRANTPPNPDQPGN